MNERERAATGQDDATAGTATASAPRGGWRRCLLLAATAAATLLGAGVSHAQTTCPPEGCLILPVRTDTSTAPSNYPTPVIAYHSAKGSLMELRSTPSFAYDPTKGTVGWYSSALSSTTWPTTSTAPAQVLQSAQTSTLRGGAATTSSAVTVCPPDAATNTPMPVTGLLRYANQYGYTSGIRIICSGQAEVFAGSGILNAVITSPLKGIGGPSPAGPQQSLQTSCAPGAVGFGFSVGAGEVIDNVSLECAVTGSHSATPIIGPGVRTGTALCPKGHALTGLEGTVNANWFGSLNVIGLTGICTQYPGNRDLGAAGGGVLAYKGTSPKGAVKFSVALKRGTALGAGKSGWDYTLGGFQFAKSCSGASAKVPGKVAVFGRESAGKPTSFSLTSGRFSITGRLSGKLSKPKVSGTLKILDGACKGRRLRFTAKPSR
jgi:hypothetical protein